MELLAASHRLNTASHASQHLMEPPAIYQGKLLQLAHLSSSIPGQLASLFFAKYNGEDLIIYVAQSLQS